MYEYMYTYVYVYTFIYRVMSRSDDNGQMSVRVLKRREHISPQNSLFLIAIPRLCGPSNVGPATAHGKGPRSAQSKGLTRARGKSTTRVCHALHYSWCLILRSPL